MITKEEISSFIVKEIKENAGTNFVDIERLFEKHRFDYRGDFALCLSKYTNIILWCGWNKDAIEVFEVLMRDEVISVTGTSLLPYMICGKALTYPIAKQLRDYKKPHWLPCYFEIVKGNTK